VQNYANTSKISQNWNQYPAGTITVNATEAIKDFGALRGSSGLS
jgi:hypothetical protein